MPANHIDITAQKKRLNHVIQVAGPRYDTRVNLELPISFTFDVLTKTEGFNKHLLGLSARIREESRFIGRTQARSAAKEEYNELDRLLRLISLQLKAIRNSSASFKPKWAILNNKCKSATELIWKISDKLYALKPDEAAGNENDPNRDIRAEINELFRLRSRLDELSGFAKSTATEALSKGAVLINGQAGVGKTHLLCDVASNRINNKLPTYIFLGEEFTSGNPINRMSQLLTGDPNDTAVFQRINNAARKQNKTALVLIDAINESTGKVVWKNLRVLKKYKNIALVLSIRTGFEDSSLTRSHKRSLTIIEHEGFGSLDWKAVTNFFKLYKIPLPKVPIVTPEFRNPLFLKLFCETYKRSGDFRGHLGTTKLFEAYNKKQGSAVIQALGLPRDPTRIWKKVIKPVAQWMADNGKDRILERKIVDIIEDEFPGQSKDVLKLLQRHWLLTKVPHYTRNGTVRGHEYRFPYQKFSDHLIARCLLTTHLDSSNPKESFSEKRKLGKLVSKSWNYGLIEALSIQVPERLKGTDMVSVVPEEVRNKDPLVKGFLQSLVWRDLSIKDGAPKYFNKQEAVDYINKYLIRYDDTRAEFLEIILGISGIPEHPLNADSLHKFLNQFSMSDRDRFWQSFVHYNYEEGTLLKRLIDWAWFKESKRYISDEALRLVSIPLVWFLASSDRTVRDRSTKALIELLKSRESVLIKIMGLFRDVNDPYVTQRLYAVAYGCSLRSKDENGLKQIAKYVYESVFKSGEPPTDILLRDYARNTVQLFCEKHPRSRAFNPTLFKPTYNSKWPERVPSLLTLQRKYREDEDTKKDYSSIWMSLMYDGGVGGIADFGNYVVNSNLNHFTNYRIGVERDRTENELLEEFITKLNKKELEAWKLIKDSWVFKMPIISFIGGTSKKKDKVKERQEEEEKIKAQEVILNTLIANFKKTVLSKTKYKPYVEVVNKSLAGTRLKSFERFDTARAQRWMFNRVIQLGWDPKKHGDFDRLIARSPVASRDRDNTERIGKKYQWIALHEMLAMASDNFYMNDELEDGGLDTYSGTWQLSIRDIDPTHTIANTNDTDTNSKCWWEGASYSGWNNKPRPNDWQQDPSDIPDLRYLLQVKDDSGLTWLNLKAYYTWKEPLPDIEESRRYDT